MLAVILVFDFCLIVDKRGDRAIDRTEKKLHVSEKMSGVALSMAPNRNTCKSSQNPDGASIKLSYSASSKLLGREKFFTRPYRTPL